MVSHLRNTQYELPIKVFDFFSGCGGTCKGFKNAGMDVVFAIDNDRAARLTFKANFRDTRLSRRDIERVSTGSLKALVVSCKGHPILFSASAPCQPFTKQKTIQRANDERQGLLNDFQRFVEFYEPELVFVENVPGMQKIRSENGPFSVFLRMLDRLSYSYVCGVIASQSYGVPQLRRRLVLIASRLGSIDFPIPTHGPQSSQPYSTVGEWIADLPPIAAGETHPNVLNHRAAALSQKNLERIRALGEGGDRRKWPEHLKLKCHLNGYDGHTDVYGRMHWGRPASGLTTRCISLSNGRFGHPEQDRAISVREAACLQTFPRDFVFRGNLNSMARQIGNAVPVLLAEAFGRNFIDHVNQRAMAR